MNKALVTVGVVLAVLTVVSGLLGIWAEEAKFGWTAMVLGLAATLVFIATVE